VGTIEELEGLVSKTALWSPAPSSSPKPPKIGPGHSSSPTGNGHGRHDRDLVLEAIQPDLRQIAEVLELRFAGAPNSEGWSPCHAIDREDKNPSAGFNEITGVYHDHGSDSSLSIFDLAMALAARSFPRPLCDDR